MSYNLSEKDKDNPRFRFEKINVEHSRGGKIEWSDISTENTDEEKERIRYILTRCHNNKLIHEDTLTIANDRTEARVEFSVRSIYDLRDRMVWSFQELSPASNDVIVTIKKGDGFKDIEHSLYMWINHPLEEAIRGSNKYLGREGSIIGSTSKIVFRQNILPYQGFELFWNLEESL